MLTVKGTQATTGTESQRRGATGEWRPVVKRTLAGALVFTFRYSVNRRVMDMALGTYAEKGQDGLTLSKPAPRPPSCSA